MYFYIIQAFIFVQSTGPENLFVNYLSRIHREEVWYHHFYKIHEDCLSRDPFFKPFLVLSNWQDFDFVLKGLARLLTNPLTQTYLPNSTKKIQFHQELLVLFWKLCDFNKVGKKYNEMFLWAEVALKVCLY